MTDVEKEIIVALANNGMKIGRVGRVLYMSYNNIVYHIKKIKKSTGLDPKDFHDLGELFEMVCEERENP